VTLFTIGLLLWCDTKPSLPFWAIPIFWGIMATVPVLFYQVYADVGTVLAGIVALLYYLKWPAEKE
jgi:hypothetical protein